MVAGQSLTRMTPVSIPPSSTRYCARCAYVRAWPTLIPPSFCASAQRSRRADCVIRAMSRSPQARPPSSPAVLLMH